MIPLFDSLAHPTLSGQWVSKNLDARFDSLIEEMEASQVPMACAVGLAGKADYEHVAFAKACSQYPQLVPVAGFDPIRENAENTLPMLADLGYKAIKIHPRYSQIQVRQQLPVLTQTLQQAQANNLVVIWCTYYQSVLEHFPTSDPFFDLVSVLKESPETKVMLAHGGGIRVMEYAELARFNFNILLDLSLTLMKYEGSSVDADLQFLFSLFDRRICLGSDWPEYSLASVRKKAERLSHSISEEKCNNIFYGNLARFFGIDFKT